MYLDLAEKWQRLVDLTAQVSDVPACLIIKTDTPDQEVPAHDIFVSSNSEGNPYHAGQLVELGAGHDRGSTVENHSGSIVHHAIEAADPAHGITPDDDMIFQIGYPLAWPDGSSFGTFCVLDRRENKTALERRELLAEFARVIEEDLALLIEMDYRKRTETILQETLAGLEQRVEELARIDERKDQFLAMLAHELRNPLGPLRSAAQLMTRLGLEKGKPEGRAAAVVERQVGQLARIVDDLQDVSWIAEGRLQLQIECGDLASIVELAVETSLPRFDARNQLLEVIMPQQAISLEADSARLAQVFGNLLHNASKFSDNGATITFSAGLDGDEAVVKVADNGIGIAGDDFDRVFDMFVQIPAPLHLPNTGVGLGLSYVRNLVNQHSGTVTVHSDGPGKGSEFTVRLPALGRRTAKRKPSVPEVSIKRVLVVDDNVDAADTMAELLVIGGFEAQSVHDGKSVLKLAEEFRPDAILLDLNMPEPNGFDLCKSIRKSPWSRDTIVIAVSGWGHHECVEQSREVGFDRHLVKPVSYEDLLGTLSGV